MVKAKGYQRVKGTYSKARARGDPRLELQDGQVRGQGVSKRSSQPSTAVELQDLIQ